MVEPCDELIVILNVGFCRVNCSEADRFANAVDDGRVVVVQVGVLGRLSTSNSIISMILRQKR